MVFIKLNFTTFFGPSLYGFEKLAVKLKKIVVVALKIKNYYSSVYRKIFIDETLTQRLNLKIVSFYCLLVPVYFPRGVYV